MYYVWRQEQLEMLFHVGGEKKPLMRIAEKKCKEKLLNFLCLDWTPSAVLYVLFLASSSKANRRQMLFHQLQLLRSLVEQK